MIDIAHLRELISKVPSTNWSAGACTGRIETCEADGIHGRTLFVPLDEDNPRATDVIAAPEGVVAEAALAAAAVQALPQLLDIADAAFHAIDAVMQHVAANHGVTGALQPLNVSRIMADLLDAVSKARAS